MAPIVPGQTEKALPPEFLRELVVQKWPRISQAEHTVWDAPIACSLPFLSIRDVEVEIHHVGLKGLQRSRDNLPLVLGFVQGPQGGVPAGPEQVLLALRKAMVDLPNGVQMLEDD